MSLHYLYTMLLHYTRPRRPKIQSIIAIQPSNPLCALKIFQYESFCGAFFKKRPINTINYRNTLGRRPKNPQAFEKA